MRFSAPRSTSPSPVRKSYGGRFRAPSVYDTDSDDDASAGEQSSVDFDISVDSALSDDAKDVELENEILELPWSKLRLDHRTPEELSRVAETVTSIRNHTRYVDAYEEWESSTRRNAFETARRHQHADLRNVREGLMQQHALEQERFNASRVKESEYLRRSLEARRNAELAAQEKFRERWKERNRLLWNKIESAISEEEAKWRAQQEREQRVRDEEARQRREEEDRKKREDEARKKEAEETKRKEDEAKQKEEEARRRQEAEEAEEKALEEKVQQERLKDDGAVKLREATGMYDSEGMWHLGLRNLKLLKTSTMRAVKGPKPPSPEPANYTAPPAPPLKKIWSAQRRKITPKIGQLTDDPREIDRIIHELKAIVAPQMPSQEVAQQLHFALLSSFAKAVIMQAETEVTANKAQAGPLARVAIGMIVAFPSLGELFWAKLCERAGCWAAGVGPSPLPEEDRNALSDKEKRKRWGNRPEENLEDKVLRIAGVMRVYFAMLFISLDAPPPQPLPPAFRPWRFWMYLAQLLNNPIMLGKTVAPEIIYVALDEGGVHAKTIWGKQFVKMLQVIYEGVQGEQKMRFGGSEVLAQASRARCQLEVEKIMR